jgi:hypothetical protein
MNKVSKVEIKMLAASDEAEVEPATPLKSELTTAANAEPTRALTKTQR